MATRMTAAPETAVSGPYNTEHGTTLLMTTNPAGAAAVLNAVWRQGFISGQQEQASQDEARRARIREEFKGDSSWNAAGVKWLLNVLDEETQQPERPDLDGYGWGV